MVTLSNEVPLSYFVLTVGQVGQVGQAGTSVAKGFIRAMRHASLVMV